MSTCAIEAIAVTELVEQTYTRWRIPASSLPHVGDAFLSASRLSDWASLYVKTLRHGTCYPPPTVLSREARE